MPVFNVAVHRALGRLRGVMLQRVVRRDGEILLVRVDVIAEAHGRALADEAVRRTGGAVRREDHRAVVGLADGGVSALRRRGGAAVGGPDPVRYRAPVGGEGNGIRRERAQVYRAARGIGRAVRQPGFEFPVDRRGVAAESARHEQRVGGGGGDPHDLGRGGGTAADELVVDSEDAFKG